MARLAQMTSTFGERSRRTARLNAAELEALLARLGERKSWA
jgi:hypothetical protein